MTIQRPRPIVDQVNDILRKRIHDRVYPPGSRLPAESDIAQELGVSRATVRTVLAKLATDGLILRKQGDGTYVNARIRDIDTRWGSMWDFERLISANGFKPTIQAVSNEQRLSTKEEQELLGLDENDQVLGLTRLFLADERPAIWVHNTIPTKLLSGELGDVAGSLSLQQILQTYCAQSIAYAMTRVEAYVADETIAAYFHCPPGKLLLRLVESFYNRNNEPLATGLSFCDYTAVPLRLVQAWG